MTKCFWLYASLSSFVPLIGRIEPHVAHTQQYPSNKSNNWSFYNTRPCSLWISIVQMILYRPPSDFFKYKAAENNKKNIIECQNTLLQEHWVSHLKITQTSDSSMRSTLERKVLYSLLAKELVAFEKLAIH